MSAQRNTPSGAYRQQDGQIVRGVHPLEQWCERCPPGWEAEDNLRAIWRESEPVDFPPAAGQEYARVHAETDMVLIAEFGFVQTCVALDQYPDHVRRHVHEQVRRESR